MVSPTRTWSLAHGAVLQDRDRSPGRQVDSVLHSHCWLSILIPVYNVDRYLEECLWSIAQHLLPGVEIIIVNDASTDQSATVIAGFSYRFGPALHVIHLAENGGLAAARNRLLAEARGDYCWFVDGDDVLCTDAILALHRVIQSSACDLVLCDFRVQREHFGLKHRLRGESHRRTFASRRRFDRNECSALIEGILLHGQLHVWSKIARRSIWQCVHFPEGRHFEDIATLPQLLRHVRSYVHIAEPWIGYRQREGSILAQITPRKIRDQLFALGELRSLLDDTKFCLDEDARFALNHFALRSHSSLARRLSDDHVEVANELRHEVRESLREFFPHGPDQILLAYRQRGWWMRIWRARRSLLSIGVRVGAH